MREWLVKYLSRIGYTRTKVGWIHSSLPVFGWVWGDDMIRFLSLIVFVSRICTLSPALLSPLAILNKSPTKQPRERLVQITWIPQQQNIILPHSTSSCLCQFNAKQNRIPFSFTDYTLQSSSTAPTSESANHSEMKLILSYPCKLAFVWPRNPCQTQLCNIIPVTFTFLSVWWHDWMKWSTFNFEFTSFRSFDHCWVNYLLAPLLFQLLRIW